MALEKQFLLVLELHNRRGKTQNLILLKPWVLLNKMNYSIINIIKIGCCMSHFNLSTNQMMLQIKMLSLCRFLVCVFWLDALDTQFSSFFDTIRTHGGIIGRCEEVSSSTSHTQLGRYYSLCVTVMYKLQWVCFHNVQSCVFGRAICTAMMLMQMRDTTKIGREKIRSNPQWRTKAQTSR